MLLLQFTSIARQSRRIGILDGAVVRIIQNFHTTYELAHAAIRQHIGLGQLAQANVGGETCAYAELAENGLLLPPLDHIDVGHCYVTGTGLTHLGSAGARDAMHKKIGGAVESLSDSMKMFRLGVEGGKPADGVAGVQPEWFYKGNGSIVRAGGQPLDMPDFSLDGGEEPEIAGLYVIGDDGSPYRVGFAIGNEFSDHITERQNYLYLAHSKLRTCGVGPALLVGELPAHVTGTSRVIDAAGKVRWEKDFLSGERNMSHTIANLEHHHFKYALFRQPGDVHIHFFGTATLSFAEGVSVQPGETFEVESAQFGPALRNPLTRISTEYAKVNTL